MDEPGRTHAAAAWWRGLSGAWRANVGLYCLATLALIALVAQIATDGGRSAQRVEVASRAPISTAPTSRPQMPTTAPPTTAVGPATTQAPAPPPGPVAPNTPPPPAPLSVGPFVPNDPTTIPPPACRNSANPDCGPFFWDPAPAPNQQLSIDVTATATPTSNPGGRNVTFAVRVADPDHPVTDNCAQIDFGDGSAVDRRPCSFPPCPDAHGAWEPPPAVAGDRTFSFAHRYSGGTYTATFTFHTDDDPPCPNPYGSAGQFLLPVPGS